MSPRGCNTECAGNPVCDFCYWYDYSGTEEGVYTFDGWCELHFEPRDPGSGCRDFLCFRAVHPRLAIPASEYWVRPEAQT